MTVQVLGMGCPKCRLLKANTAEAIEGWRAEGTAGIELVQAGRVLSVARVRSIILETRKQTYEADYSHRSATDRDVRR